MRWLEDAVHHHSPALTSHPTLCVLEITPTPYLPGWPIWTCTHPLLAEDGEHGLRLWVFSSHWSGRKEGNNEKAALPLSSRCPHSRALRQVLTPALIGPSFPPTAHGNRISCGSWAPSLMATSSPQPHIHRCGSSAQLMPSYFKHPHPVPMIDHLVMVAGL